MLRRDQTSTDSLWISFAFSVMQNPAKFNLFSDLFISIEDIQNGVSFSVENKIYWAILLDKFTILRSKFHGDQWDIDQANNVEVANTNVTE